MTQRALVASFTLIVLALILPALSAGQEASEGAWSPPQTAVMSR